MGFTRNRVILAKTGDYTITTDDEGALFTNRGASGAVNFTTPTAPPRGFWFEVHCVAAQNVTVTAGTADTMILFNDATADSIAWSTAGEIIGSGARFTWDGTGWITQQYPASTSAAQTVATVTIVTA